MRKAKIQRAILTAGACIASAVIFAVAQSYQGFEWLAFVAFVPAGYVLQPRRLWHTFGCLALFNGVYTGLCMHWLRYAYPNFEWVVVLVGLYAATYMIFLAAACWAVRSKRCEMVGLLVFPAAFALAEVIARLLPIAMTWALMGQPLTRWTSLAQVAALGGAEALTFIVLSFNIAVVVMLRKADRKTRSTALIFGPVLLAIVWLGGAIRLGINSDTSKPFHVGVIQPYVRSDDKADDSKRSDILARYDRLIDQVSQSSPDIDMIVLPETAVRGLVRYEDDLTAWVKAVVTRTRLPFLFGSLDQSEDADELSNVAVMITPYDTVTFYRRQFLMPIAEYTPNIWPLTGIFRWLARDIPMLTAGHEATVFELKDGPGFGVMICYEDVLPNLGNTYAAGGAELLIALINTERFYHSSQPYQHLRRAQLTAIASGLPMIRCTNSGISCTIDRYGRVDQIIMDDKRYAVLVEGARVMRITVGGSATVYRWTGDWLAVVVYGAVIGCWVLGCSVGKKDYTNH